MNAVTLKKTNTVSNLSPVANGPVCRTDHEVVSPVVGQYGWLCHWLWGGKTIAWLIARPGNVSQPVSRSVLQPFRSYNWSHNWSYDHAWYDLPTQPKIVVGDSSWVLDMTRDPTRTKFDHTTAQNSQDHAVVILVLQPSNDLPFLVAAGCRWSCDLPLLQ